MRTVLHLTIYGTSPVKDWYLPIDNIAQVTNTSPVNVYPIDYPVNTGGNGSYISVNESFSDVMAAIATSSLPQMLTLTAYNVTPTQYYYVPANTVTSITLNASLGTIVDTTPTISGGSIGMGQFQVNESPADIAAEIGSVVVP